MFSERTDRRTRERVPDDLTCFHRTLAELCRKEVPLPRALRLLAADLKSGKLRVAAEEMAEEVERGVPLAEAYGARKDAFPRLYRALVAAGAAGGDLPGALAEIAGHALVRADAARRLRKALAYPLVTAVIVFAIGTALFLEVGPRLWNLSAAVAGRSPPLAGSSVSSRGGLHFSPPLMLALSLGLVGLFAGLALLTARRKGPLDILPGFRLPVIGSLRLDAARASLASALSLLLSRRLPLPAALDLAAETVEFPALRSRVRAMADRAQAGESLAGSLEEGEPLGSALEKAGRRIAPRFAARAVAAVDGTGALPAVLEDLARETTRGLAFRHRAFLGIFYPLLLLPFLPVLHSRIGSLAASAAGGWPKLLPDHLLPFAVAAAALVLGLALFRLTPVLPRPRWPGGRGPRAAARARVLLVTGRLLREGLSLPEALRRAAGAAGRRGPRRRVLRAAARIEGGTPPGRAWPALGGEGSPGPETLLGKAEETAELVRRRTDRALLLVHPLALVVFGTLLFLEFRGLVVLLARTREMVMKHR